jgi:hypothetical protein
MSKVAMLVLADTESHADLGRVVNAMTTAREFKQAGDEVQIIFDGAGTQWPGQLSKGDHRAHALWESVRDVVTGACDYCAEAFDATHSVREAGVQLLDEYHRHPSIRNLVDHGYQVISF